MEKDMRIGIIGSGALGLYYGAMLQRSGEDVHFLLRRDYSAINEKGLQIYSANVTSSYPGSPDIRHRTKSALSISLLSG
jgi:ketopantoate reductase